MKKYKDLLVLQMMLCPKDVMQQYIPAASLLPAEIMKTKYQYQIVNIL